MLTFIPLYMCVCVYVDLYKGSYYCRLSNLLDINAPNICLLPIKKETQVRQGARKVLVYFDSAHWFAQPKRIQPSLQTKRPNPRQPTIIQMDRLALGIQTPAWSGSGGHLGSTPPTCG